MISTPELVVLFRILAAHILADFFLQRYKWIVDKRAGVNSPYLYYHVAIVGTLTYLFLADWTHWQLPLFIMVTHFLIDWWKSTQRNCTRSFIIDQVLHVLMLVIGWLAYTGLSFGGSVLWIETLLNTPAFWIITCSYLLVLRPVGFLIGKATNSWREELEEISSTFSGLNNAGTWIGYLERVIILTFLLIGQYSGIGFLIAAKSIFRYTGKSDEKSGYKQAEYILIGTLMSFLTAIVVGIGSHFFLGH